MKIIDFKPKFDLIKSFNRADDHRGERARVRGSRAIVNRHEPHSHTQNIDRVAYVWKNEEEEEKEEEEEEEIDKMKTKKKNKWMHTLDTHTLETVLTKQTQTARKFYSSELNNSWQHAACSNVRRAWLQKLRKLQNQSGK